MKLDMGIYLKEHIYKNGLKSQELAQIVLDKVGDKLIIADSAEPRLIHEVKQRGCNIKPTKKAPGSVIAGINFMLDYELIIDPNSIGLIKELNNYMWSDKKSGTPVDNYNHYIDAARYAIQYQLEKKKTNYASSIL